jgi:hypothetical protein
MIEVRTITKPVAGTVKVHLDRVEQASGWSVDTTTGLVTFGTPPALGLEITVDVEFDVPMRFDTDQMAVTIETYRLHAWQQIPDRRAQDLSRHLPLFSFRAIPYFRNSSSRRPVSARPIMRKSARAPITALRPTRGLPSLKP